MQLAYTIDHARMVQLVFGSRGLKVFANAPLALATDGRDRVDFDRGWEIVNHTAVGFNDPWVVLHEFAHLYHVVNWRELSLAAPEYRCEAAAHLAEAFLANRHPKQYGGDFGRRYQGWNPAARVLLDALYQREELDFGREIHDQMRCVLAGEYIDRYPELGVVSG